MNRQKQLIIVRGGGDIATGTIHRLHRCGYPVLVLETGSPSAIRRQVAFSEAIYDGQSEIEGVTCLKVSDFAEAKAVLEAGAIPMMMDETCEILKEVRPWALVDAILAKKNLGTNRNMADKTIGLGPGFAAGEDVDLVIETMRGHNLGRNGPSEYRNSGADRRRGKGTGHPFAGHGDPFWKSEDRRPGRKGTARRGHCYGAGRGSGRSFSYRPGAWADPGRLSGGKGL